MVCVFTDLFLCDLLKNYNTMEALELRYNTLQFNDDEFFNFCQQNDNLKFERTADGTIIIMPNTGGKTGNINAAITSELYIWNKAAKLGRVFDSSTAFRLPSSAVRSADSAFVTSDRWDALAPEARKKFPPICPDFVIELMSESDTLTESRAKMLTEWMGNGCQLAWLIDPKTETTYIYRADGSIQINHGFQEPLSGEGVLPGFMLDLSELGTN
jgi:Uma2 family endonuclease